jgi:hypothetical protein
MSRSWNNLDHVVAAGVTELVTVWPNWFPCEKGILLS